MATLDEAIRLQTTMQKALEIQERLNRNMEPIFQQQLRTIQLYRQLMEPIRRTIQLQQQIIEPYVRIHQQIIAPYEIIFKNINFYLELREKIRTIVDASRYNISANIISPSKRELFTHIINEEEIPENLLQEVESNIIDFSLIDNLTTEEELEKITMSLGLDFSDETIESFMKQTTIKEIYDLMFSGILDNFKSEKFIKNLKIVIIIVLCSLYYMALENPDFKYSKKIINLVNVAQFGMSLYTLPYKVK